MKNTVNMKPFFILSFLLMMGMLACQGIKYPEFQKIKNVKILTLKASKVRIGADAVITNYYPASATIVSSDLNILLMKRQKATVKQVIPTEIPASSTFNLPFEFEFSPKEVWKKDLWTSTVEIFKTKKVDAVVTGTIKVKVAGLEMDMPVEEEMEVLLSDKAVEAEQPEELR